MQRRDERRELLLRDVLELVEEQNGCSSGRARGLPHGFEQGWKVLLEIAVVRESRLGIQIKSHFDVAVFDFQGLRETSESSQTPLRELLRLLDPAQLEQSDPELRRENRG